MSEASSPPVGGGASSRSSASAWSWRRAAPASVAVRAHAPLDTTTVIETPEQVRFTLHLAGPLLRGGAYLIDASIRGFFLLGVSALALFAELVSPADLRGWSSGVVLLLLFIAEWGYFIVTEMTMAGQSPGKRVLGLRVVSDDGRPLGWPQSMLRNLLRAADFLPVGYVLGTAAMVADRRFKRLGDQLAATLVVVERRTPRAASASKPPAHAPDDASRARWNELDHWLRPQAPLRTRSPLAISRVAALYRASCSDLMRGRAHDAEHASLEALDALVARAHHALYAAAPVTSLPGGRFLAQQFPATVRKNLPALGVAALAFGVPLVFGWGATLHDPQFALQVLPASSLTQFEQVYRAGFEGRSLGTDSMMAGFYVYNNVSIAFRCFATGILFGTGSIFFLLYNGLLIGTVFGFVTQTGAGAQLFAFVASHAPLELTAVVISGAAGLKMGYALVETHGRARLASLKRAAPELVVLVLGAAAMLGLAALIEAYWSASSAPRTLKLGVGGLIALALVGYFGWAGRGPVCAADDPRKGNR